MGALTHFNLDGLIQRYGIKHFVETGTGNGVSLTAAQTSLFDTLHSIEIVPEIAQAARVRFGNDKRVHIWEGDSRTLLPQVLDQLPDGPCLFWLDAHFSGSDSLLVDFSADKDLGRRLPLQDEIETIARFRRGMRDVILCDDARIYQDGDYAAGPIPENWGPIKGLRRNFDFVRRLYGTSHRIVIDFADHGYLMVCPPMTYEEVAA